MLSKAIDKKIEKIAKDEFFIETLETRNSDQLDFYDISVWSVKKALERAYELGKKDKTT